jgi:hypothetical protein
MSCQKTESPLQTVIYLSKELFNLTLCRLFQNIRLVSVPHYANALFSIYFLIIFLVSFYFCFFQFIFKLRNIQQCCNKVLEDITWARGDTNFIFNIVEINLIAFKKLFWYFHMWRYQFFEEEKYRYFMHW